MEPRIVYEDDSLLIVDKPAGMTVNRSDTTHAELTVQDWTEKELKLGTLPAGQQALELRKLSLHEEEGEYPNAFWERGGIVHRLDKETSGVLIVAKTPEAFVNLQRQFKEREVEKVYQALAHGKVTPSEGEINMPVGRLPWNRRQFGIVAGGRESVTFYEVIAYYQSSDKRREMLSFLELYPKTGRTHQIRVHLKYINHPIFSDFLYAGRKTAREDRKLLSRVFLHAARITFTHPVSGERVTYASSLPPQLQGVISHATFLGKGE